MTRPISDLDVSLAVVEADVKRLALQQAYRHRPEPFEAEFAQLACACPEACSCPADYPGWTPPHSTPMEAS